MHAAWGMAGSTAALTAQTWRACSASHRIRSNATTRSSVAVMPCCQPPTKHSSGASCTCTAWETICMNALGQHYCISTLPIRIGLWTNTNAPSSIHYAMHAWCSAWMVQSITRIYLLLFYGSEMDQEKKQTYRKVIRHTCIYLKTQRWILFIENLAHVQSNTTLKGILIFI